MRENGTDWGDIWKVNAKTYKIGADLVGKNALFSVSGNRWYPSENWGVEERGVTPEDEAGKINFFKYFIYS